MFGMDHLSKVKKSHTRSISAENKNGEKGKGGMATEGTGTSAARDLGQKWKISPSIRIAPGELVEIANIDGPGVIRHIWLTCGLDNRQLIIRMYWDGSENPSVECPVGDFFANPCCENHVQISSFAVCVNSKNAMNCYWSMPFRKHARITIENQNCDTVEVFYQIDYELEEVPEDCAYFHAQFRRTNPLPYKEDYVILDGVKGTGQYVGTFLYWGVNNCGWWGEGEVKFYLDGDKEYPTICGTGTEDYFCGSWNFDIGGKYQEFCTPYAGLSKIIRPDGLYNSQQRFSLYRWHITDPVYFKKDIKVTIQALGWQSGERYLPLQDDISSVAFWYQDSVCRTFPGLPGADELEII